MCHEFWYLSSSGQNWRRFQLRQVSFVLYDDVPSYFYSCGMYVCRWWPLTGLCWVIVLNTVVPRWSTCFHFELFGLFVTFFLSLVSLKMQTNRSTSWLEHSSSCCRIVRGWSSFLAGGLDIGGCVGACLCYYKGLSGVEWLKKNNFLKNLETTIRVKFCLVCGKHCSVPFRKHGAF